MVSVAAFAPAARPRRPFAASGRGQLELLRAIVETTPECIKLVAADGRLLQMNPAGLRMVEADVHEQVAGTCAFDLIAPEHRALWRGHHERVCAGESLSWEFDIIGLRGTRRHTESHAAPFKLADGSVAQLAITRDITAQKRIDDELRLREQWRRDLLQALPAAIYTTDAEGRITFYNDAAVEMAGRRPQLGDMWCVTWKLYTPDGAFLPHDQCPMAVALREGRPIRGVEAVAERPDGGRIPFMPFPTPLFGPDGKLVGAVNMLVDITDRKNLERIQKEVNEELESREAERTRELAAALERLRETEHSFSQLVGGVTDYAIFRLDTGGHVVSWNAGAERIKGYGADEIVGEHFSRFYTEADRSSGLPQRGLATAAREGRFEAEGWRVRKDGSRFWANVVIDAIREGDRLVGFAKVTRDITDRKVAERALVESERLARGIIDTALDAFVQVAEDGSVLQWNPQAEALFGWTRDEAVGKPIAGLIVPPSELGRLGAALQRQTTVGAATLPGRRLQLLARHREGRETPVELSVTSLDQESRLVFNVFIRDLTEKLAAEAQLVQAQKMEAVGQLTGGVAHDFNNLLAAIIPSLEMAKARINDERALKYLETAAHAASRGAALTHQLLAFSRKQHLASRSLDVNSLIERLCEMLPRTLGPAVSIEPALGAVPAVMTDPSQLEVALLNLAINARDAMPAGGRLTISTSALRVDDAGAGAPAGLAPGDYVVIAVTDTGVGMPEDVRVRAFEPFFSTKSEGRGSGLGLSMVYGFARQCGGQVAIESAVGSGTTIRIYLPHAAGDAPQPKADAPEHVAAASPSRVLVLDDDAVVRGVTAQMVRNLGHEVVEVEAGAAALELLGAGAQFDAMVVDLAMPNMHGAVFAVRARQIAPDTPVLFVTGYADAAWTSEVSGDDLLKKPFNSSMLADKLRTMLPTADAASDQAGRRERDSRLSEA